MNEQTFTTRGFYFLLGCIITSFVMYFIMKPAPVKVIIEQTPNDTFQIKKDSSFKELSYLPLTEENLKKEIERNGIQHPQIVLAQAKLESGLGKSKVYKRTNNLFGLKGKNGYRSFEHWSHSVQAYKKLVQSKYNGGDYYKFLTNLPYASDPQYVDRLKELI